MTENQQTPYSSSSFPTIAPRKRLGVKSITSFFQRFIPGRSPVASAAPAPITAYRTPTGATRPASARAGAVSGIAHPAMTHPDRENPLPSDLSGDDYARALLDAQRSSARLGEWNRYRTLRMRLAQHKYAGGKYRESLELLMDIWYLDLNGPRDINRLHGAQLGTEAPGFDPRLGQVSTTVQRKVRRIANILNLSMDEMQAIFFAVAGPSYRAYHLPLPPREAWFKIGSGLLAS